MAFEHFRVKIFAETAAGFHLAAAIPVFHRWIQTRALDERMIDVADYQHVPDGPGILLVCHDAHYGLEESGGRAGLLYTRRTVRLGTTQDRIRDAYRAAATACRKLEEESEFAGKLQFDLAACEVSINDRLLAPNNESTWSVLEPDLRMVFTAEFGDCSLTRTGTRRDLLTVRVKSRVAGQVRSDG